MNIMAIYKVNISQVGEYVLWGRVQARDGRNNSFFVQIDDNEDNLWEIEIGDLWHWDKVSHRVIRFGRYDSMHSVRFLLLPGTHTIKVKLREDGTKLDKLLLTNDTNFVPQGKGDMLKY